MGRKLRSNSTKLKGIRRSGPQGNWIARKVIPTDLQGHFGKKEFWASLGAIDENTAIARGAPLPSDWAGQIDRARASRNVLTPAPMSKNPSASPANPPGSIRTAPISARDGYRTLAVR
jgi:hypothetical protein